MESNELKAKQASVAAGPRDRGNKVRKGGPGSPRSVYPFC
jgi:hypothetical protein